MSEVMDLPELQVSTRELMGPRLDVLRQWALIAAVSGLVLCGLGVLTGLSGTGPNALGGFFQSYLYAYLFWFGVTSGSLGLLMLHNTVGGGWGYPTRRFLEASTRLFLPVLILFIPVVIGLLSFGLYEWARPGAAADPIIRQKSPFLNTPFFLVRTLIYFAIFGLYSHLLNRWSAVLDDRNDIRVANRLNVVSVAGLVLFVLTVTVVAIACVMSLTPGWYSSIFGLLT